MKRQNYKRLLSLVVASLISSTNPLVANASEVINNEEEALESENFVVATNDVNVRMSPTTQSKKIGLLKQGQEVQMYTNLDNGWYEIEYNNSIGYVSGNYVKECIKYEEKETDTKLGVILNDTIISDGDYSKLVEKNEVVEVLNEEENSYIVKYEDVEGFVDKNNIERLVDTFVIVDISDQELKLYEHNNLILTSPVVTGTPTPARHTNEGLYSIYDISYNRDLVGPNYRSYVDVMMKFNKGEGLHDAEYHTDYNSAGKPIKKHGWRSADEFVKDTYLTNGSHGCVNMLHDDAIEVSNHVSIGTKVLVKK